MTTHSYFWILIISRSWCRKS